MTLLGNKTNPRWVFFFFFFAVPTHRSLNFRRKAIDLAGKQRLGGFDTTSARYVYIRRAAIRASCCESRVENKIHFVVAHYIIIIVIITTTIYNKQNSLLYGVQQPYTTRDLQSVL